MSYRYRELSLKERGQLLLVVLIAILIGTIFFGTALLVDRIFPGTLPSVDFWYFAGNQNLSPGAAAFASLAMVCAILAFTLFGTAIFSTLAFLYLPLTFMCLFGIGSFFAGVFGAFGVSGLYGIGVFGLFAAEAGLIVWVLNKLVNWYDSRFGIAQYISVGDILHTNKPDYLGMFKDKYR
jgi:hypothetical protein